MWNPGIRDFVTNLATLELTIPVPSKVVPSMKVTIPEGLPVPGGMTEIVTLNVTFCPDTDGLTDDVAFRIVDG